MKYTIKIHYVTGDSFGSHETTNTVELEWENLDVAKENLQRIKEHYEYYSHINEMSLESHKRGYIEKKHKFIESVKEKDWFVEQKYYDSTNSLKLKTDNGKDFLLNAFWIGYFERLKGAEIIMVEPKISDMEFWL